MWLADPARGTAPSYRWDKQRYHSSRRFPAARWAWLRRTVQAWWRAAFSCYRSTGSSGSVHRIEKQTVGAELFRYRSGVLAGSIAVLRARRARALEARRAMAMLERFDDRMLRDIGIYPDQLDSFLNPRSPRD